MEFALRDLKKSYGDLEVLAGLSMEVGENRIVAVLGPSGCGKTTLLSLVAGLSTLDSGAIDGMAGKPVSFLFQEPRLLDWMTVSQNLAFVLKDCTEPSNVQPLVESYLTRVGLIEQSGSYPRRLSGGQRQRVAMARALAYPSRVLLMDEPFKSLDLGLKYGLIRQFLELWNGEPRTVLCVTHDVKEAVLLADEVYVLSAKPTTVRSRFDIEVPQLMRHPDDAGTTAVEHAILRELLREF